METILTNSREVPVNSIDYCVKLVCYALKYAIFVYTQASLRDF